MTLTVPPVPRSRNRAPSRLHWVPTAAAWAVGIAAGLSLLASMSPVIRWAIRVPREFIDKYLFNFPDTSLAWAFVLALLAAALSAHKRIAWWLLIANLVIAGGWNASRLLTGTSDRVQVIGGAAGLVLHVAAIAVLVAARNEFWAKVRRGALLKSAATLAAGWAVAILLCWGLIELFPGTVERPLRLPYVVNRVVGFGLLEPDLFPGKPDLGLRALCGLLGALALVAAAIVLFLSQRSDNALTGQDESAIRGLLKQYGQNDSLGYFATRRDKSVVFAPNGRAAITYRVEVGVCLASGDPVGDPRAWPQAINAWLRVCRDYGWAPGVMGASAAGAQAFRDAGLSALELGDEAILRPAEFKLSGPDMRGVRQAVTRARRSGLTVRIRRHGDIGPEEMARVIAHADAWRDTESERGFSMALGRLGDPADAECLLVEAVRGEQRGAHGGEVVAMLSLVPWGHSGASLDLMRRSPQSPNGTIELMVSELALQAGTVGVNRISLNFAMFRSAFEQGAQLGAGPVLRLWRRLLMFFSRWWQLETLYRSNMKYRPQWVPRYACYEDARLIPRVGVASVIAEGFLVLPFSRRNEQHTGQHPAVPEPLAASGRLHDDGTAPDCPGFAEPGQPLPRVPEQVRVRMAKLKSLQGSGVDAYPVAQPPSHSVTQALAGAAGQTVSVAGRVLRMRDYGGVLFAQLRDWSGEVQLLLDDAVLAEAGDARAADFSAGVDLGDLVEAAGRMGQSRNGTPSLLVTHWRLIGKCLHPLPDKWKGLTDPEARLRARYVDLAVNAQARELITARSNVLRSIRDTLFAKGFLEVETPILQQLHGGANARPVRHSHQRLRPGPVSADRPGALPQATVRGRRGAGVRAGPGVSQRGRRLQPQPGVHPVGGVRRPTATTWPGSTGRVS